MDFLEYASKKIRQYRAAQYDATSLEFKMQMKHVEGGYIIIFPSAYGAALVQAGRTLLKEAGLIERSRIDAHHAHKAQGLLRTFLALKTSYIINEF